MSVLRSVGEDEELFSEHDITLIASYAIRGSKRAPQPGENVSTQPNLQNDLIQMIHFEKALHDVCNEMRKIENKNQQKNEPAFNELQDQYDQEMEKMKAQKLMETRQPVNPEVMRREVLLITKITQIFREREVTFFDAFQQHYDPLKPKNFVTIKLFKDLVR